MTTAGIEATPHYQLLVIRGTWAGLSNTRGDFCRRWLTEVSPRDFDLLKAHCSARLLFHGGSMHGTQDTG